MNKNFFRSHHLLTMLKSYEDQQLPLDLFISNYFRANSALGSKDRGYLAETIYGMARWRDLIDHLCGKSSSLEKKIELFESINPSDYLEKEEIPLHVRLSFPEILFDLIVNSHGLERAIELCSASNTMAPTTLRVNRIKGTRDELLGAWQEKYSISPTQQSPNGIIFHKKINFFELQEFRDGFFEIQDEGSQILADLINVAPGQLVMDYCSGSGGKTLAFAPKMENKGQIYLHDIRPKILIEAKKRLKRAGIQNGQVIQPEDPKLKKIKKKMDWVLVDVPCSGTGTMRRNPDMKWKFTVEMLQRLAGQQRIIFEKALSFMKPNGRIVYATCSILKEENQEQVEHFIKTYNLQIDGEIFQSLPSIGSMDGFFGVVLRANE